VKRRFVPSGAKARAAAAALTFSLGVLVCGGAQAQGGPQILMTGPEQVAAPGLAWSDARSIPSGTRMIMVYGRPDQPGPYIFRVRFPAGYRLPPHRHPDSRAVTVLKGSYWSSVGETFQQEALKRFGPRDYYVTEAGVPHFAWAETDVVIQEAGVGPIGNPIQYVNPADDPRR
jgi:quercetin dioxygenase-like cupin family protein